MEGRDMEKNYIKIKTMYLNASLKCLPTTLKNINVENY